MNIIHTHVSVRPDSKTQFYFPPESFLETRQEFMSQGKILERVSNISDDGLVRTVTTKFADEESFLEFFYTTSTQGNYLARRSYNQSKNILETVTITNDEGNPYIIDFKDPE